MVGRIGGDDIHAYGKAGEKKYNGSGFPVIAWLLSLLVCGVGRSSCGGPGVANVSSPSPRHLRTRIHAAYIPMRKHFIT